jgi:hypothetical protein
MVVTMTSHPISSVKDRVCHGGSVKHCMKALDLWIYLLTILRQQGCELIDDDPGGQCVVCRRAVNLLALPLDPANFLMEPQRPILESFSPSRSVPVKLAVVSPGGDTILSFIFRRS